MIPRVSDIPRGHRRRAGESLETSLVERLLDIQAAGLLVIMACALLVLHLVWPEVPVWAFPAVMVLFGTYIVGRNVPQLVKLDQGLAAERKVGDSLDMLVAYGGRILHDVPFGADKIDHVVVSKQGIFVVETQHLPKQKIDTGLLRYHQGRLMKSSGAVKGQPEFRVKRNASHIADILHAAGFTDTKVEPVLIIPGWSLTGNRDSDEAMVFDTNGFAQWLQAQPGTLDTTGIKDNYGAILSYVDRQTDEYKNRV